MDVRVVSTIRAAWFQDVFRDDVPGRVRAVYVDSSGDMSLAHDGTVEG